jgi:hypothetical protein
MGIIYSRRGGGTGSVDLTGYATEAYVQNSVSTASGVIHVYTDLQDTADRAYVDAAIAAIDLPDVDLSTVEKRIKEETNLKDWRTTNVDMPTPRMDPAIAQYNNKFYLWGGTYYPLIDHLYIYDPGSDTWSQGPEVPEIQYVNMSFDGDYLYSFGGSDRDNAVLASRKFNMQTQVWSEIPAKPEGLDLSGWFGTWAPVVSHSGTLFSMTVSGSVISPSFYLATFDCSQETWNVNPLTVPPVFNAASIAYEGKIYVYGGSTLPSYELTNQIMIYDIALDQWTSGTPGIKALNGMAGDVYEGKLYFFGGIDGEWVVNTSVLIYDIGTDSWSEVTTEGLHRESLLSAKIISGKAYLWGGYSEESNYDPDETLEIYDINLETLTSGSSSDIIPDLWANGVFTYEDKIYVYGGDQEAVWVSDIDIYDPLTNSWTTQSGLSGDPNIYGQSSTHTVYSGKWYIHGGSYQGGKLTVYDFENDIWDQSISFGYGGSRRDSVLVGYDDKLFLIDGVNSCPLSSLDIYDLNTNEWVFEGSTDGNLDWGYKHTGTFYQDKLYVWGGVWGGPSCNEYGLLNSMKIYDLASMTTLSGMPVGEVYPVASGVMLHGTSGGTPRVGHSAALIGNKIYYYGGRIYIEEDPLNPYPEANTIDVYDIPTDSWTVLSEDGDQNRTGHASGVYGIEMFIFGGLSSWGLGAQKTLSLPFGVDTYDVLLMGDIRANKLTASGIVVLGPTVGSGTFSVSGTEIVHNLGTTSHVINVTAAGADDYNAEIVSSLGTVYVKKGTNSDWVYKTGDADSDVLGFDYTIVRIV